MATASSRHRVIGLLHAVATACLICIVTTPVSGADRSKLYGKDPDLYKVSSHLLEARNLLRQGLSLQQVAERMPLIRARQGMLEVEVRLTALDAGTMTRMRGLGIEVMRSFEEFAVVDALVDAELLDELARIPEVAVIRPQFGAITNAGSVDNQADVSINADDARVGYGIDGTGVSIGVLSDSFSNTIGGSLSGSGCSQVLTG